MNVVRVLDHVLETREPCGFLLSRVVLDSYENGVGLARGTYSQGISDSEHRDRDIKLKVEVRVRLRQRISREQGDASQQDLLSIKRCCSSVFTPALGRPSATRIACSCLFTIPPGAFSIRTMGSGFRSRWPPPIEAMLRALGAGEVLRLARMHIEGSQGRVKCCGGRWKGAMRMEYVSTWVSFMECDWNCSEFLRSGAPALLWASEAFWWMVGKDCMRKAVKAPGVPPKKFGLQLCPLNSRSINHSCSPLIRHHT